MSEVRSSGGIHCPKPYKFIGFGGIHGPKPYKFIEFGAVVPAVHEVVLCVVLAPPPVKLTGREAGHRPQEVKNSSPGAGIRPPGPRARISAPGGRTPAPGLEY